VKHGVNLADLAGPQIMDLNILSRRQMQGRPGCASLRDVRQRSPLGRRESPAGNADPLQPQPLLPLGIKPEEFLMARKFGQFLAGKDAFGGRLWEH
jgi:hypothetical protein